MTMEMNNRPYIQRERREPLEPEVIVEIMSKDGFGDALFALHGLAKTGFFDLPELDQGLAFALVDRMIHQSE